MEQSFHDLFQDTAICSALRQAWDDSNPSKDAGHEEGGFILQTANGNLYLSRWTKGTQNRITVPLHAGCKVNGDDIVATFHTHPNTGDDYLQEPSITDIRSVQNDPELKGKHYIGEFVISQFTTYLITRTGTVIEAGDTEFLLLGR